MNKEYTIPPPPRLDTEAALSKLSELDTLKCLATSPGHVGLRPNTVLRSDVIRLIKLHGAAETGEGLKKRNLGLEILIPDIILFVETK